MFRWLHMSALRAALLTTRFSRTVVLAAMGAMLPPIPPSDGWHIVTIPSVVSLTIRRFLRSWCMNEVQSFMVSMNACRHSCS